MENNLFSAYNNKNKMGKKVTFDISEQKNKDSYHKVKIPMPISKSNYTDFGGFMDTLPNHPHILNPCQVIKEYDDIILLYNVHENGMTLRDLIQTNRVYNKSSIRKTIRNTFTHLLHHRNQFDPIQTIIQLIETHEFMLSNNMLLGHSSINPDNVWVEFDEHGKQCVYVINTLDMLTDAYICLDKKYLSPEYINKYNNHIYYRDVDQSHVIDLDYSGGTLQIKKETKPTLNRYNTRPSTFTSVYSLGLILYFMAYKEDPFTDQRTYSQKEPYLNNRDEGSLYYKCIKCAVHQDVSQRSTLTDWKEFINEQNKRQKIFKKYLCFG